MTSTYDLHFYFDPVCPFAWMTSKWVRMVAGQRDYRVDWRFISLRILNANVDYATHFPAHYEEGHTAGLKLLRVAAKVRAEHGRDAVGPLYAAIGARLFDTRREKSLAAAEQAARELVESALADAGLPADLADALDDAAFDDEIRGETDEALTLTGRDVGTPILHFQPPDRDGVLRPGDQQAASRPKTPSRCGITSSRWRRSPASPRSSAACANVPNSSRSASTPNRLVSKRTGTAAAVAPRSRVCAPRSTASHGGWQARSATPNRSDWR